MLGLILSMFLYSFFPVPCPFDVYVCFFPPVPSSCCFFVLITTFRSLFFKSERFRETLVCHVCFFTALAKTRCHNICS